jgi:hypothetical protein
VLDTEVEDVVAVAVVVVTIASFFLSRNRLLIGSKADTDMTGRSDTELSFGCSCSYGGVGMDDENSSTSTSWWTGASLSVFDDAIVFTDGLALGVGMFKSATASRVVSETRWTAPNRGRLGSDSGEAKSMASISRPRGVEGRSRGEPRSSAPVVGAVWYRFSGDLLLLRVTVSGRDAIASVSSREATTGLLNCLKWSCIPDDRTGATSSEDGFTGDEDSRSTTSGGPDVFRTGDTILGLALLGGDNGSGEGRFEDRF